MNKRLKFIYEDGKPVALALVVKREGGDEVLEQAPIEVLVEGKKGVGRYKDLR